MLLEQLNRPEYPDTSRRLASAFDVISIFIGYLVRCLEDESIETLIMSPDNLLKLRKGISETMSVTIEYLRDRWDASVAGAMGLHPDARVGEAKTSMGSHFTLTWDSMKNSADADPYILAAVRALSLWLREDENDLLRKEATGLTDMFLDLYQSDPVEKLDFRSPVLVALEVLTTLQKGRRILLDQNGWDCLMKDLRQTLQSGSNTIRDIEARRGIEIIRILINLAEHHATATEESWMDFITLVASRNISDQKHSSIAAEFEAAVLQLCCSLLVKASIGMRQRYQHSISAINGSAQCLSQSISPDDELKESMDDVLDTLSGIR